MIKISGKVNKPKLTTNSAKIFRSLFKKELHQNWTKYQNCWILFVSVHLSTFHFLFIYPLSNYLYHLVRFTKIDHLSIYVLHDTCKIAEDSGQKCSKLRIFRTISTFLCSQTRKAFFLNVYIRSCQFFLTKLASTKKFSPNLYIYTYIYICVCVCVCIINSCWYHGLLSLSHRPSLASIAFEKSSGRHPMSAQCRRV